MAAAAISAEADTLTVDDCVEMALGANNSIKASEYQTRQAKAMVKSLRANYFPDISASATGIYSNARGSYSIEGAICRYSHLTETECLPRQAVSHISPE